MSKEELGEQCLPVSGGETSLHFAFPDMFAHRRAPIQPVSDTRLLVVDSQSPVVAARSTEESIDQEAPFEPVQETSLLTVKPAEEMTFSHLDLTSGGQKTPSLMPLREAVFGAPGGVSYRAVLVGLFLVLVLLVGLVQAIVAFAIYRWIAGRVMKK